MRKIILSSLSALLIGAPALAQDKVDRVVEPIPAASTDNLYRVSADRTPSGFVVPRFVSLKFSKVNGRTGPSRDHPIAWQYQRRGLPLLIVAETEMWRKVRDISGDEAWVRKPALSGSRTVLALQNTSLRARPDARAREVARTDAQALLRLQNCREGWCEVKSENGLKGWARQDALWGAQRP
ncbi:MAG: SH3 domain-containing protein [Litorimonas sp.]